MVGNCDEGINLLREAVGKEGRDTAVWDFGRLAYMNMIMKNDPKSLDWSKFGQIFVL